MVERQLVAYPFIFRHSESRLTVPLSIRNVLEQIACPERIDIENPTVVSIECLPFSHHRKVEKFKSNNT